MSKRFFLSNSHFLGDLPNFRYIKGISSLSDNLDWFDMTCSGGEDVRGIWDNNKIEDVINISCHRSPDGEYLIAGDEEGHLRLFSYTCADPKVKVNISH